MHYLITKWLRDLKKAKVLYKETWGKTDRKIYLSDPSHVEHLVLNYGNLVYNIDGPTSTSQFTTITSVKKSEIVRNRFYYDKYDVRLVIKPLTLDPVKGESQWSINLRRWLREQDLDFMAFFTKGYKCEALTIYLTSKEYDDIEGFFLLEVAAAGIAFETRVIKV